MCVCVCVCVNHFVCLEMEMIFHLDIMLKMTHEANA